MNNRSQLLSAHNYLGSWTTKDGDYLGYQLRYGATIFAIVLAMNKGMDYWVSFCCTHPSSLHLKAKFVKKNRSRMIVLTGADLDLWKGGVKMN